MDSSQKDSQNASQEGPPEDERRSFLMKVSAIVTGSIAGFVPVASGMYVFLDPLRRKAEGGSLVKIATLDAVPDDGIPRSFPVIKESTQTFTRFPLEPVGRIFLRRLKGEKKVMAYQATCPHAGCDVEFDIEGDRYSCPCHNSLFEPDGARINPKSCPAPRDLDTLVVDVKQTTEDGPEDVWVEFKKFRAGRHEKIEK